MPSSRRGGVTARRRSRRHDDLAPADDARRGSYRAALFILSGCGLLASFLATALVPAAGTIGPYLGVGAVSGSWALTATFLAAAASTPIAGRAADLVGDRRVLTILVATISVGTAVCALTDDLVPMVIGRTLQGCGAGVIPVGMSIIRRLLGPSRAAVGASTMSVAVGLGGGVGLPLAAWITEDLGISALFWIATAAGVSLAVGVRALLPPDPARSGETFDPVGALGLVAVMLCLLIPVSQGPRWGWTSPVQLSLLGAGVVVAVFWMRYEMRHRCPLVDLRAARSPVIAVANIASGLIGLMYMLATLTAAQLLQTAPVGPYAGMGESILITGILLTPGGLVIVVSTPVAARLIRSSGAATALAVAAAFVAVGYLLLLRWHDAPWQVSVGVTVVAAGVGMGMTATPVMISVSTPPTRMAAAQALNVVARFAGTAVASALVVAVLEAFGDDHGAVVPSEAAYRALFVIGGAVALLTCALSIVAARRRLRHDVTAA